MFNILKNKNGKKQPLTINDVLQGCTTARMQSVGYMQVIPLLSQQTDNRFISPKQAEVCTRGYGNMEFENSSEGVLIVPLHAGYLVSQKAQNHAMSHAGMVAQKTKRMYETAMCIQQSQGGMISKGSHQLSILPFALREKALDVRKEKSYNKLWDSISSFNQRFDLTKAGHLEYFMKHFKKELDQFVAEFEPLPQQVGAIVLIDGQVVGIERAPSYEYWKGVWSSLIRECYGSLAIQYRRNMGDKPSSPKMRLAMSMNSEVKSLVDVRKMLETAREQERAIVEATVESFVLDSFLVKNEENLQTFRLNTITNSQFQGQIIQEKEDMLYASLFVRAKWQKGAKQAVFAV